MNIRSWWKVAILMASILGSSVDADSFSPSELTKEQMESCQSKLCLGETGKDLVECEAPLKRLKDMKPSKRADFLSICPLVP